MLESIRNFFTTKRQAYQHTFAPENQAAQRVLQDLAKFCRAHQTTFHPDPRVHAVLEGRREVFLRIERLLNLSPEEIWDFFGKAEIQDD